MVHLVKVGVVAFLIFCTLAQSAPTRRKDAISKAVRKLVNAKGDTTRSRRMKAHANFATMLTSHPSPELVLFEKIVIIAAANFPKLVRYTIDDLLSPLDPVAMDGDRIRLARLMAFFFHSTSVGTLTDI
ncbi:hypothetical protein SeLEV6574_g06026 [Synchytrium endobioticum]|uniref:Uncharacterized protein n=1 Tax=Synchytrium endobioticum TaxID=286115 RepID=A0A507CR71_9FUNG|nr:hypothetical protein SeLEV6574_g06026 [Synchytrium endobioticum]